MYFVRGTILGHDIFRVVDGLANEPRNFEALYQAHTALGWEENLKPIVAATIAIAPTGKRFEPPDAERQSMLGAPETSRESQRGGRMDQMERNLQARLEEKQTEILRAVETGNMKLRGDAMEYLLTGEKTVHGLEDSVFEEKGGIRAQTANRSDCSISFRLCAHSARQKISAMNAPPEQLMSLLQKRTPNISVQAAKNSSTVSTEAIEFAKAQGYKVTIIPQNDPADPGGCMSLLEVFSFSLKA